MHHVFDDLPDHYELWLVSTLSPQKVAKLISKNSLSKWFDDENVYFLPEHVADHQLLLISLVEEGVIYPGKSLWIDHHPIRTMLAVRQEIDASIFVDAERLHRDLELWGIISLEN